MTHTYICERCRTGIRLTVPQYRARIAPHRGALYCDECKDKPWCRRGDMPDVDNGLVDRDKGLSRETQGLIATLVNLDDGEQDTIHRDGLKLVALREIAHVCDTRDGDWRVRTLSSPQTILGDLDGSSRRRTDRIEVTHLSRIGRLDLLERRGRQAVLEPRRARGAA